MPRPSPPATINRLLLVWVISTVISVGALGATIYSAIRTEQAAHYIACLRQHPYNACRPGWAIASAMRSDP